MNSQSMNQENNMSIIREIKAAFRWVFNIKDEVKPYDVFQNRQFGQKIYILSVHEEFIFFRFSGCLKERSIDFEDFHKIYRKIS